MLKICETCKQPYSARRSKRRYCSASCSGKASPSLFKAGHSGFVNSGSFKSRQVPVNVLPIGSETIRERRGECRAFVKTEAGWRERARVVWESANGTVPRGHVVHHINENPLDDRIENLQALTRADHVRVHAFNEATRRLSRPLQVDLFAG